MAFYLRATPLFRSFKFLSQATRSFSKTNGLLQDTPYARISIKDGIAVIKMDEPGSKVNTLSPKMKEEFGKLYQQFANDKSIKAAVIMSAKPGCFLAGADINMLLKAAAKGPGAIEELSRNGQETFNLIERSEKPVVAAIMGSCLGGGNELQMACKYRIAVKDRRTFFGQPEVMLGLLPGAGGTQRLLQQVPINDALQIMLTGKNIKAEKAKKLGLVHELIDPIGPGLQSGEQNTLELLEKVAVDAAKKLVSGELKVPKPKRSIAESIMQKLLRLRYFQNYVLSQATNMILKNTGGNYPAPSAMIEVVRTSLRKGYKAGYEMEAKKFGELAITNENKALIGLFFGQTECKKNQFGKPAHPTKTLGILGAGLMGAGIAQVSLNKNWTVILKDVNQDALARGRSQIQKNLALLVKKKKITSMEAEKQLTELMTTIDYSNFKNCDMIIEAVFEDLGVKHKVIRELEQHIPEHCILATNTSALPITKIAEASKRPEKVVGMHYFSPVDKMMLLEIVRTDKTTKDTLAAAADVGLKQGKVVITVKDSPGFYTSRVLGASCMNQAMAMLLEGVSPKKLDKIARLGGWPVGTATLLDEVGIDIAQHVSENMSKEVMKRFAGQQLVELEIARKFLTDMVNAGFKGRKSGKGLFIYKDGVKDRPENKEALEIIKKYSASPKKENTNDHIMKRLELSFVNDAIRCLEEGILANPREGDIGAVFGLGFPPFHGGPFRYVDLKGSDVILREMEELYKLYGRTFEPSAMLKEYARNPSKKFHKL